MNIAAARTYGTGVKVVRMTWTKMAVTVGRFQLLSPQRATRNTGGVVDEDKDHAIEGPCEAEKVNAVAWSGLFFVANDDGDGDVEEEKCGDKLDNEGSVEGLYSLISTKLMRGAGGEST